MIEKPPADEAEVVEDRIERRKIQLSGRTTFVVSLPKAWVQAANLRAGDTVGVAVQDDGSVLIIPGALRRHKEPQVAIDATGASTGRVLRELMAAYTAGYDLVTVRSATGVNAAIRAAVQQMTAQTVGLEVVEETDRAIILKDMLDTSQFASRSGLQRLSRIVLGMLRDALEAVAKRDLERAADVIARDDSVDRMYLMIAKQHVHLLSDVALARRQQVTLKESLFLAQAARALERCGDHAARISYAIREADPAEFQAATWQKVQALAETAMDLLERSVAAFMKGDKEDAHAVVDASERLTRQRGALTRELLTAGEQDLLVLGLVVESLERVHQYGADIAEVALANHASQAPTEQPTKVRAARKR